MFSDEMSYDPKMLRNLNLMCMFLRLFHTFDKCVKQYQAHTHAFNDLQLIPDMIYYRAIDKDAADIVLDKLNNHRWYLAEDIVPFALFSKSVPMMKTRNCSSIDIC